MTTSTITTGQIGRSIGCIETPLSSCEDALAAYRQRRRTYIALSALDNRTLRDIGLDRSMLLGAAILDRRLSKDAFYLKGE